MAFSFLNQELAIDLGTANTVIYQNDQIVLDEPSIVAIDNNTGKCIALGTQAKLMHERTSPGVKTVRPLRDGVIADFNAAEMMIRGFTFIPLSLHLFEPVHGRVYGARNKYPSFLYHDCQNMKSLQKSVL